MRLDEAIARLGLPTKAQVNRRVTKKLLVQNSPRTFRKAIEQGIEQVQWVAVLKPGTCALATGTAQLSGGDAVQIAELSVLTLTTREGARGSALIEAIHRAVPYHVLLWIEEVDGLSVSTAWKRPSLAQAGQVVLSGAPMCSPRFGSENLPTHVEHFIEALALSHRPAQDLASLYQHWNSAILGAQVAEVTGSFNVPTSPIDAEERKDLLDQHNHLSEKIARLAKELRRATQVRDRVALSTRLKRAEQSLADLQSRLTHPTHRS